MVKAATTWWSRKGSSFPTDYYIPFSAVENFTENQVYLNVGKDEALNQGWDMEPQEGAGAAPYAAAQGAQVDAAERPGAELPHQHSGDNTMRVPVHEEELEAATRTAKAGDVTISKRVVTDQESIEVPVAEERVRVEWRSPTGDGTADPNAFEEGSIEVPVSREEVVVSKRAVQTGELDVTKEREEHMEKVTDTVRREVVDVDESGTRVKQGEGSQKSR